MIEVTCPECFRPHLDQPEGEFTCKCGKTLVVSFEAHVRMVGDWPKRTKIYLSAGRDMLWDRAASLGLLDIDGSTAAAAKFVGSVITLGIEVEVQEDGTTTILKMNGRDV